ncbi:MAG: 4'-phosphopantetheinyl transferase superfamily protein [Bacteroidetes bacterium]|nr:4'-phosphopantetheinyl transferase superfamily protein [Bacteroidota bacterium]
MPTVNCISIPDISFSSTNADSQNLFEETHIWPVRVSADIDQLKYFNTFLLQDELEKAARYHQEKDRRSYITSRAALRTILSKYLHQQPNDIRFKIGLNKKPFLENTGDKNINYNISHSGDWILIAISNSAIGTDVEKIDANFNYEEIFPVSFSDTEIDMIKKSSSPRKDFYIYWTRKEALTKATGKGLDDHFKNIPCIDGSHTVGAEIAGNVQSWSVISFNVDDDYVGSVACDSKENNVRFLEAVV